ncbi:MAG: phenylalanine--tRNA ligase subunit alpha [Chloroflexota bacterium]|nr:phenylalanine--tRNA ligase subunit alpha [Chloroflexota bacterium]
MEHYITELAQDIPLLTTPQQVRERRRTLLAQIRQEFRTVGALAPEERRKAGRTLNALKDEIERLTTERLRAVEAASRPDDISFDPDLPAPPCRIGRVHLTTAVLRRVNAFFGALGFEVADGPEIESDWYNFSALNLPTAHPAREMHDTIYIQEPEILLRTHTSPVEIHAMQDRSLPLRVVVPGKAYRNEDTNATNSSMFYHFEGLAVGDDIHMGHLRWVLDGFLDFMFGPETQRRFRAKYYPQVEPGLGVDLLCRFCSGAGCTVCKAKGWIEILGAGMVHPSVLSSVGIDWTRYSGFAFGMGLDRLVMGVTGIADIRELYGSRMSYVPEV